MKQLKRVVFETKEEMSPERKALYRGLPKTVTKNGIKYGSAKRVIRPDGTFKTGAEADGEESAEPENSNTAYPLTADRVHIHEINIVKGRLQDGNGTRVKKSFQNSLTQKAIALRDAGKATRASKLSLGRAKRSQSRAAAMRPSKFKGPRVRTKLKKPTRGRGSSDQLPDVALGGTAAERVQREVGNNPEKGYR